MRQLQFRGFNEKNQRWITGFYLMNRGAHFVCPDEFAIGKHWWDYEVYPNSVGQYTGIMGTNGEICEGDIIKIEGTADERIVVFYEGAFCLATREQYESVKKGAHPFLDDYAHLDCLNTWCNSPVKIIGKIYED